MLKFLGGPVAGVAAGISPGLTWALHQRQRRQLRGKPLFSKRSRNIVRIFRRFGMPGIAFLTPILFSPIGGTVIATQLHVPRVRILLHMLWSAAFWAAMLTLLALRFSHLAIFHH